MNKLNVFISVFMLLAASATSVFAEADNWEETDTKTYTVSDFKSIHLEGTFKVELKQSDKPGVRIKADTDDFKNIEVQVRDSVLDIELTKKYFSLDEIILYIDYKELERLHIDGGVKLTSYGYVEFKDFYMRLEGGTRIDMKIKAQHVKLVGEGGVSVTLEGVSNNLDAKVSGAAYVNAEKLKCSRVDFKIEGVGAGYVYATDYLYATIDGIGRIGYKGSPHIYKNIGGLGTVAAE